MADIELYKFNKESAVEMQISVPSSEKELQTIFEKNLNSLLDVHLLATEYSIRDGRIDTLGIDDNNRPVIIEYKLKSSGSIIVQGLCYLNWLKEQKPTFNYLVLNQLGNEVAECVDWSSPRLICIANDFSSYDEFAIKEVSQNILLVKYKMFDDNSLVLEYFAGPRSNARTSIEQSSAERTTCESEILESNPETLALYKMLAEFLLILGDDVQEDYLKYYVAFRRIKKTIARIWLRAKSKGGFWLDLNLDLSDERINHSFIKPIPNPDHQGVCTAQIVIKSVEDVERAKPFIEMSYERS